MTDIINIGDHCLSCAHCGKVLQRHKGGAYNHETREVYCNVACALGVDMREIVAQTEKELAETGNVVELDEFRPHLTVFVDEEGARASHVIPVALVRDWAAGKEPLPDGPLLRAIILDWCDILTEFDEGPPEGGNDIPPDFAG